MPRTFPFLIFWAIYWAALRPVSAECLSPLSAAPDWQGLGVFQQTIAHDEFTQLLARVYAPGVDLAPWFKIEPTQVRIAEGDGGWFILKFSGSSVDCTKARRTWGAGTLGPLSSRSSNNPLTRIPPKFSVSNIGRTRNASDFAELHRPVRSLARTLDPMGSRKAVLPSSGDS